MEDCFDYDYASKLAEADELRKLFEYYRKFAKPEHNDKEAQFNLACCYFEGIGIDADHREAFKWFKKSAEQGHIQAQSLLAGCYKNGIALNRMLKKLSSFTKWPRNRATFMRKLNLD